MRRISALFVSVLFFFSLAGAVLAADKVNMAAGAVKSINAGAKSITLAADKQPDFTCFFDDRSAIRSNNGKPITFADIKIGNIVIMFYRVVDGRNMATNVTVASPGPATPPDKKG